MPFAPRHAQVVFSTTAWFKTWKVEQCLSRYPEFFCPAGCAVVASHRRCAREGGKTRNQSDQTSPEQKWQPTGPARRWRNMTFIHQIWCCLRNPGVTSRRDMPGLPWSTTGRSCRSGWTWRSGSTTVWTGSTRVRWVHVSDSEQPWKTLLRLFCFLKYAVWYNKTKSYRKIFNKLCSLTLFKDVAAYRKKSWKWGRKCSISNKSYYIEQECDMWRGGAAWFSLQGQASCRCWVHCCPPLPDLSWVFLPYMGSVEQREGWMMRKRKRVRLQRSESAVVGPRRR